MMEMMDRRVFLGLLSGLAVAAVISPQVVAEAAVQVPKLNPTYGPWLAIADGPKIDLLSAVLEQHTVTVVNELGWEEHVPTRGCSIRYRAACDTIKRSQVNLLKLITSGKVHVQVGCGEKTYVDTVGYVVQQTVDFPINDIITVSGEIKI